MYCGTVTFSDKNIIYFIPNCELSRQARLSWIKYNEIQIQEREYQTQCEEIEYQKRLEEIKRQKQHEEREYQKRSSINEFNSPEMEIINLLLFD